MGKNKGKQKYPRALKNMVKKQRGPPPNRPEVVFIQTLLELMTELQTKYPGLVTLSRQHEHRLLEGISCTLYERLTHISNALTTEMNCLNLTSLYRRVHNHKTDVDMITTAQSRVDNDLGLPATKVTREALLEAEPAVASHKISEVEANVAIAKVLTPITFKLQEHLGSLQTIVLTNTEEERAQIQVRMALQMYEPHVHQMLSEALIRAMEPHVQTVENVRMKMYGEPYMPSMEQYRPVLQSKVHPVAVMRSRRMYNYVMVTVAPKWTDQFLALDGIMIGTAQMVCRRSVQPEFQIKPYLVQKIKEFFGIAGASPADYLMDERGDDGEEEGEEGEDDDPDM